jgi:hypothetical protein
MPDAALDRAIALVRAGLALGFAGAVLLAVSPSLDLVTGPSRSHAGTEHAVNVGSTVGAIGAVAAVGILAAIVLRLLWLHMLGLLLSTGVALIAGLMVIGGRRSDGFARGADVSLAAGGALLVVAFWVALVGVAVALVGMRMVAVGAPPVRLGPGLAPRARTAPIAAVLGLVGVVIVVTAPLGVAYGTLALGDIRSSGNALSGRGMAIAGVVLGILVLSLLAAVGGVGSFIAEPA